MGERADETAARVRALIGNRRRGAMWVCARLGVPVYAWPLTGRIRAVYVEGAIGYRPGLPYEEREHLLLHELGHHLMHRDLAPARAFLAMDGAAFSAVEREAERFAYLVAAPEDALCDRLCCGWDIHDLAAFYQRSPAWIIKRIALLRLAALRPAA